MTTPILTVNNLSFRYDQRLEENILSHVSFTANRGEWLAVVGHNGSGKSTLAQVLIGLLPARTGSIQISDMELNETTKWDVRNHIGLVFQNPDNQFIGTTVEDDVAFGLENTNMPYQEMKIRVEKALEMVDMTDFRKHDPSRLSGGQKQRVAIAGLLALRPSILILDEAFVMLDPTSRRELLATLRKLKEIEKLTIISITHDMNEAAVADRILLMESGTIACDGTPSEVFKQATFLEPPFAEKLRQHLAKSGRTVPDSYMSENEMVNWLCK